MHQFQTIMQNGPLFDNICHNYWSKTSDTCSQCIKQTTQLVNKVILILLAAILLTLAAKCRSPGQTPTADRRVSGQTPIAGPNADCRAKRRSPTAGPNAGPSDERRVMSLYGLHKKQKGVPRSPGSWPGVSMFVTV